MVTERERLIDKVIDCHLKDQRPGFALCRACESEGINIKKVIALLEDVDEQTKELNETDWN